MEVFQDELVRLEAGLAWATILEQVLLFRRVSLFKVFLSLTDNSEKTLADDSHQPSPLAALPHYQALQTLIAKVEATLPGEMRLLQVITEIRDKTWEALKQVMSRYIDGCRPFAWLTSLIGHCWKPVKHLNGQRGCSTRLSRHSGEERSSEHFRIYCIFKQSLPSRAPDHASTDQLQRRETSRLLRPNSSLVFGGGIISDTSDGPTHCFAVQVPFSGFAEYQSGRQGQLS